ncbi:UPF0047-domain-containing protein [Nadsonia fulvescens var. elongata DSM 6958]|uniref:UPF0047-domain-containing protein n=1 Tax=Nadsonia fulvescens var. elongata DSM 6958 TaxID=857566 RepID=A0A1E3PTG8_9ASCO|nr:UPF0047-domain-containing protein [Nadsonia fulvescens var. elongata DSM 6958]
MWKQKTISLKKRSAGCYLVTDEIVSQVPELREFKVGMANIFLQHTSAALTLNENWDTDVRADMKDALDGLAPRDDDEHRKGKPGLYRHDDEGPDDMPAHIKSSLIGASLNIPVKDGALGLGTWQGIWLCEFRDRAHSRRVVVTIQGE